MIEATERAWWWELTGGGYGFQPGEPWRSESPNGVAREGVTGPTGFRQWGGYPLFRDTRWTPPLAPLAVGDVITECTPENLPADGVAIVDAVGDVGQLDGTRLGWACGGGVTWGSSVGKRCFPMTVIYVPKVGGDDD